MGDTRDMARVLRTGVTVVISLALIGCPSMEAPAVEEIGVTQRMRDACPVLTDEVLEAFILAVSSLRDEGLSESDATAQWVDGCASIPPDGSFQGDQEACRTCMPVIVDEVYAQAEAGASQAG